MMTWEEFKVKFSRTHVPPGLIKRMRDEFRELKQGRMTVVEYRDKFLSLARYAPDEIDTEAKKKERFLNGLHDEMQTVLVNIPFVDIEALVDSAIQMEGNHNNPGNPNNFNRAPPKFNNNNAAANTNTAPRTGSNVVPVAAKDKSQVTCYDCGNKVHFSNECPKKNAASPNANAPAQHQRRVHPGRRFALGNSLNRN